MTQTDTFYLRLIVTRWLDCVLVGARLRYPYHTGCGCLADATLRWTVMQPMVRCIALPHVTSVPGRTTIRCYLTFALYVAPHLLLRFGYPLLLLVVVRYLRWTFTVIVAVGSAVTFSYS